jgi:hypothetical protein
MHHTHHTVAQIESLIANADGLHLSTRARERLTWLRSYAVTGSVSETCRLHSIPRVTFYRLLERFDPAAPASLEDQSRRPHTIRTTVSPEAARLIREYRVRFPHMGREQIAAVLEREHGMRLSPSAVGRAMAREGLTASHPQAGISAAVYPAVAPVAFPLAPFIAPAPLAMPAAPASSSACSAPCLLCAFRSRDWKPVKRAVVVGSVISNLVILGMLLLTAFSEGHQVRTQAHLQSINAHASSASIRP